MSYLRIYNGKELKREFELTAEALTIGRTDQNDLVLNDPGVSRHHATIKKLDGGFYIEDNSSRNGVFLNKKRVEREKLKYWDEIQIHNYVIKFMAVPSLAGGDADESPQVDDASLENDKTVFVSLASERQLENLRNKTRQSYLTYVGKDGKDVKHIIKAAQLSFGKAKTADIRLSGWFAPGQAATLERQGSSFMLIPAPRGNVIVNGEKISAPIEIKDGMGFLVRNQQFKFFNRLAAV